jgi:hypothetical protein
MTEHKVGTREEWTAARNELLELENAHSRAQRGATSCSTARRRGASTNFGPRGTTSTRDAPVNASS